MSVSFEIICRKIEELEIQGASKIAKAGLKALKIKLEEKPPEGKEEALKILEKARKRLFQVRPTEPFLRNAVRFVIEQAKKAKRLEELMKNVDEAKEKFSMIIDEGKKKIAQIGARRINGTVLTYCHSSTAIGILKKSSDDIDEVYVTETRPRYQGRTTASELVNAGFKTFMIVDGAVRHYMKNMDYCLVGSDVITSEGNVINKIGTSTVALAAKEARIPFYVATNLLKFDPKTMSGALEKIEEREADEIWKERPPGVMIKNPAFDVTPKNYIDGLITEVGIISPEMIVSAIQERFPWVLASET